MKCFSSLKSIFIKDLRLSLVAFNFISVTRNLANHWQTTSLTSESFQSTANPMTLKINCVTDWCACSIESYKMMCWNQSIWTSPKHSKFLRWPKLLQNRAKSYTTMQHPQRLSTTKVGSGKNSSDVRQRLTEEAVRRLR